MEIIKATINHLNEIYNLLCELEGGEELDKADFSKAYVENLNNESVFYVVAVKNKEIIGFSSVHIQNLLHHLGKVAEVQELIIAKNHQGIGVGGLLFEKMQEIAIFNGCLEFEVSCNLKRERSHKFYLKQGMKKSHYKFTKAI